MAKFLFKKNMKIVVSSGTSMFVNGVIVNTPPKILEIKDFELVTDDIEAINRIKNDSQFGTAEIREITPQDEEEIKIRNQAIAEAEKKIADLRKGRPVKIT